MWSVNLLVARAFRGSITPISLAFFRWTVAVLVFFPFALPVLLREWKMVWKHRFYIGLTAFLGVTVFNTLIYYAGRTSPALNLSLISITFPIIILLLSRLLWKEALSPRRLLGVLVVLVGIVFLLTGGRLSTIFTMRFVSGDLLMLAAATVFAVYSLLVRKRPIEVSLKSFQFATFFVGVILLLPAFIYDRISAPLPVFDAAMAIAVLYVGIFASLLAFLSWNKAIELVGASKAGLVYYSLPVLSGFSAWLVLGEPLGLVHVLSMVIVVVGIIFASRG